MAVVEQMVRQVVQGSRRDLAASRKHVSILAMLVVRGACTSSTPGESSSAGMRSFGRRAGAS